MTSLRPLGVVLALAVAAGCGSTVSTNGSSGVGINPNGTNGLSVLQPSAGGATPNRSSGSAAPAGGPSGADAAVSASRPGVPNSAGPIASSIDHGAPSGTQAISGPGVTATTVTIGMTYYQNAEAANAALGGKGVDTGDPVAGARILINWINKTGGVAGRRLVALFYGVDPQSATPYAAEAQAECTDFTEDHKVFAVIDGTPALDARACLAQHAVADLRGPLLTAALTPNEVDVYAASLDRAFAALVPALLHEGWFEGWNRLTGQPGPTRAKVGIVTPDRADDNSSIVHVLIPALRAAGYGPDPADVIRVAEPGGFSDDGATVAAIDNAVLKLNADGVSHVILNDRNGSLSLLFNNYAYSQGYFPRYGGTSGNAWQAFLSAGDIRAKTLQGAIGIGWQPLLDVPYGRSDGLGADANAARKYCFSVFSRAGSPHTDAVTAAGQAEGCDVAFLLPAIFRGYRGALNLQSLIARVDGLGTSYALASGFASRFAPDQHDGIGAYQAMEFVTSCGCMQYRGGPHAMPR